MKFLSSIIILFFLLSSCRKEWLDEKADSNLVVPATLSDFQAMLDNPIVMNMTTIDKGEIASDGFSISDANYQISDLDERKDAYTWSKTTEHVSTGGTIWFTAYNKILYCNVILDGLKKYKPSASETATFNSIQGQALFQRAWTFFQLSQIYTPSVANAENEEYGIILRLNSDITEPSHRSTIQETFNQIITDLKSAIELLPDRPQVLSRGSKTAAYALLARVYLSRGDYAKALSASDQCLQRYSKLLDYNTLDPNRGYIGLYNDEVLFHCNLYSSNYLTIFYLVDDAFVDLFDDNDLRKKLYFLKNPDGKYTFRGNYHSNPILVFSGFSVDEVLLTRAECYARAQNATAALKDLNTLLEKRWDNTITYPPVTAANAEDALIKILQERHKNQILRGTRWMDLRRLNQDSRFAKTLTRTVDGQVYTLEPNSYKYAFPIPDEITEATGVKQNPVWY